MRPCDIFFRIVSENVGLGGKGEDNLPATQKKVVFWSDSGVLL